MAIEHKLLLKKPIITIEQLVDYCVEHFINFELLEDNSIYIDAWGLRISLQFGEDYYIYQFQENNADFIYGEMILFRLGKDSVFWEEQMKFIIDVVFLLMSKNKQEGIFIYNMDNAICYFKSDGSIKKMNDISMIERFFTDKSFFDKEQ